METTLTWASPSQAPKLIYYESIVATLAGLVKRSGACVEWSSWYEAGQHLANGMNPQPEERNHAAVAQERNKHRKFEDECSSG